MIKRTLSSLALLMAFGSTFAQENKETKPTSSFKVEHQLGLNATRFIQTFINFSGVPLDNTEFDVNYKALVHLPDKYFLRSVGLRTGLGRVSNYAEFSSGGGANGSDQRELNFRVGVEVQKKIDKRWTIYGGVDFVSHDEDNETKSTFFSGGQMFTTITSEDFKSEGFGPVLGVQFDINKHLCLSTETTMYFMKGSGNTTTTSDHPSFTPQWNNSKSSSSSIVLPAFINFSFKF